MGKPRRLGDILLEDGIVDAFQLQSALAYQRTWGTPLGQAVVDQRFCTPRQVLGALAKQTGLPAVDLDAEPLDPALAPLVSLKVAETHRVVPLAVQGAREEVLVVAIAAPASLASLDAVKSVSRKQRIVPRLATDAAIQRAIGRIYRGETLEAAAGAGPEAIALPEAEAEGSFEVNHHAAELAAQLGAEWAHTTRAAAAPRPPDRGVLIYGWGQEASHVLVDLLRRDGQPARIASTDELLAASLHAVVVAPLPAMEGVGRRLQAQVVVAGKAPETDFARAQALGARGFLAAPLDTALLLRAVRRAQKAAAEEGAATR